MVFIKDKITNKVTEFYAQYFKKGKLMTDTRKKKDIIADALGNDVYDCPQCGKTSMEEVQFALRGGDGEPGLLCFVCNHMISGETLLHYMTDEDGRRDV